MRPIPRSCAFFGPSLFTLNVIFKYCLSTVDGVYTSVFIGKTRKYVCLRPSKLFQDLFPFSGTTYFLHKRSKILLLLLLLHTNNHMYTNLEICVVAQFNSNLTCMIVRLCKRTNISHV